ncbi:hypothetical protein BU14_0223s0027 [Porphyra umbilicalis]|uniref:ATP synthase F1 subunit epsilon n=1 Tax=Porphyra umbilicalis TaxID=2786 RepID=A0A1X6P4J1_PORUM|nr:hypothetical protein BU14_0223s0027 [Porphyra umbilicalis]|eukprot:OSX75754.1 hypothetical protein BU14_0223s0027 [Porphyra umbilicalis]
MVQYWRAAGVSYLRYCNLTADAVRSALKEQARKKTAAKVPFSMTKSTWEAGKPVSRVQLEPAGAEALQGAK